MENLQLILNAINKAKGMNTVVFDFRSRSPFVDYVVITSATNTRQIKALAEYVKEAVVDNHLGYSHIEGDETSKWLLVDSERYIVHIFEENERDVYALEKLYSGIERVELNGHVSETSTVL